MTAPTNPSTTARCRDASFTTSGQSNDIDPHRPVLRRWRFINGRDGVNEPVAADHVSWNVSDLISTLRYRAPKIATGIAVGQLAWPAVKYLRAKARERTTYTVKVPANDEIYDELHEWVLGLLPSQEQRALVGFTSTRDQPTMISPDGAPRAEPRLRLRYDGAREQSVTVAGRKIKVVVCDGEAAAGDGARRKPAEIVFTATSLEAQRDLLTEIEQVVHRSHSRNRKPLVRMLNKWGDWERLDNLPARDLDSVILPHGQLERIINDVARFLASEPDYLRRCIPWHRGHLYEGPPGTGKTSVARAIASHFNMDVWYLPLADIKKDCELLSVLNRISPKSMLLLEDADVFHAATQRDDDSGVTLSGLLNALDGVATPHGLLTVLTSNSPEVLDHAVVRAGRVDLRETFSCVDGDQAARLIARWYGHPVSGAHRIGGISPADIIEACKRHDNPTAALAELGSPWHDVDMDAGCGGCGHPRHEHVDAPGFLDGCTGMAKVLTPSGDVDRICECDGFEGKS